MCAVLAPYYKYKAAMASDAHANTAEKATPDANIDTKKSDANDGATSPSPSPSPSPSSSAGSFPRSHAPGSAKYRPGSTSLLSLDFLACFLNFPPYTMMLR